MSIILYTVFIELLVIDFVLIYRNFNTIFAYIKPFLTWRILIIYLPIWFIVSGWSMVGIAIGKGWFRAVSISWQAFLWMPFCPEKLFTIPLTIWLHTKIFPNHSTANLDEFLTFPKYKIAQKALSRDTASLRRKLESRGVCSFGELGTFHMNINGEISFKSNENAIDDPEHFGFEPLAVPLLSQCNEKTIVIKQRDFSRYIAIAAAVILAFFFVMPVSDSAYEKGMQASIAMVSPKAPATVKVTETANEEYRITPVLDTVTENIYTEPQEVAPESPKETTVIEEPVNKVIVPAVPQKTFSIIGARSPNAQNAELAIKELTRKMKADYTVIVGGGRHRVSIGDYCSMNDAEEALTHIKSTFPDAWVLTH